MTPSDDAVRAEDIDLLWHIRNLYVGQLTSTELDAFNRLCKAGLAATDYNHAGGLLGLGKVRLLSAAPQEKS